MTQSQIKLCAHVLAAMYGGDVFKSFHGGAVLLMTIDGTNVLRTCVNAMRCGLTVGDVLVLYRFGRLIRRLS